MIKHLKTILFLVLLTNFNHAFAEDFTFFDKHIQVSIVYDSNGATLDSIAAHLLQQDIKSVTGYLPIVLTDISKAKGNVIVIGNVSSLLVRKILPANSALTNGLIGKWECFGLGVFNKPLKNLEKVLVITGSDARGTAYGVFDIAEKIGVSPWYWWADVSPTIKKELSLNINEFVSETPSVKYRGIFLNDEDWGLQPWAAKTFEPETGDIGPKTYARIFELLLRLKANLIWPAMHPSTKAFFHYPDNEKTAAAYSIVIGSSHAEPLLRNNVSEWTKSMGDFNYLTNRDGVHQYWESRVKESKGNEAIYTLGMRGVHDSGMEGVKSVKEAIPLLERIIQDQRNLLQKYISPDAKAVPQVFTVYKEVLDIYDGGIKLPEDVTLVWPDDNYGYIKRLNNEKENERSGGSGVYYHASYWGRPHDYLWLNSTHPGLIREEMMKAYQTKADRLWVLNIGDIKPGEYSMQLFLDMAYKAKPFKESSYTKTHLSHWVAGIFGSENASQITNLLWQYYRLAFERKPEFMGWSQTEPTTKTNYTAYNHFYYGDEAQRRIDRYEELADAVKSLRTKIRAKDGDAFYQLVYYPVTGASLMNKKFLYRDKAMWYARQNRTSAADYATLAQRAYEAIVKETQFYNTALSAGKWKNIMSMEPRNLPVYKAPDLPVTTIDQSDTWSIATEGFVNKDSSLVTKDKMGFVLPTFNRLSDKRYFIDVFLSAEETLNWTSKTEPWIKLSQSSGTLTPQLGKRDQRIWVSIDWDKVNKKKGVISFSANGQKLNVTVQVNTEVAKGLDGFKGFVEDDGYITIPAAQFSRQNKGAGQHWALIDGLGHADQSVMAMPLQGVKIPDLTSSGLSLRNNAYVEYDFFTLTAASPQLVVYTLPTHPVNNDYKMRYAIAVDGGPVQVVDFEVQGRSEEWKQNVLRNAAVRQININRLNPGKHTLRIYMIDPGVILDRVLIDLGSLKSGYHNTTTVL